jgi:hypothetical protein
LAGASPEDPPVTALHLISWKASDFPFSFQTYRYIEVDTKNGAISYQAELLVLDMAAVIVLGICASEAPITIGVGWLREQPSSLKLQWMATTEQSFGHRTIMSYQLPSLTTFDTVVRRQTIIGRDGPYPEKCLIVVAEFSDHTHPACQMDNPNIFNYNWGHASDLSSHLAGQLVIERKYLPT